MSPLFSWNKEDAELLLRTCEVDGLYPVIEKYVPKDEPVLESGCGLARYVRYLTDRGWDITGLESYDITVRQVGDIWPDLKIVQGDCRKAPFEDASFGSVISIGVVEHFTDGPQIALRDILRLLKPGGIAIVIVPCHNGIRELKRRLWWNELREVPRELYLRYVKHDGRRMNRRTPGFLFNVYPAWGEFYEYRMNPSQFRQAMENAGFETVEHIPHAIIDGVWHELNPFEWLVRYRDYSFTPTWFGRWLNKVLGRKPFLHPHMQTIVGRKPIA